jgi:hypothetical protein
MKYAVCILVLAVACGGGGGGPAGPAASQEIGAAGGNLAVNSGNLSGAAMVVPPNAVPRETNFIIRAGTNIATGAGTTRVGPAVRFGPAVGAFGAAITVTIPYSPAQAGRSAVMVAHRDDVTGTMTVHASPTVDAANGLVSVSTDRFSTFQAFIAPAAPSFDMTGFWVVSTSQNFSNPAGNADPDATFLVEVTQNGNNVGFAVQGDTSGDPEASPSGTVNGTQYSLTGGVDAISFALSDANTGTGTLSWSEDGVTGGATLSLTRQQSATFDVAGDWDVTFSNNASVPAGNEDDDETVPFVFTQIGTTWTLTADAGTRSGSISGARYFANYAEVNMALNDVEVSIEFTLTDANNGTGRITAIEELPDESLILRTADITVTRQP